MKTKSIIFLFALVFLFYSGQSQERFLLGYYDSNNIIHSMPERDDADAKLKTYATELTNQIETLQAEFNKKYEEYKKNRESYTEATRKMKENELQDLQQKAEQFEQTAQQDYQRMQAELMNPIIEKAVNALNAIKSKYNFLYLFDKSEGYITNKEITNDITDLVKYELKTISVKPSFQAKYSFDKKVRVLRVEGLLKEQAEYADMEVKLKAYATELQNKIEPLNAEFDKKYEEYKKNMKSYTVAIREMKEKELVDLQQKVQEFQQTAQQDYQRMQTELMNPIRKKVNDLLNEYAVRNNYPVICDSSVVVGNSDYNKMNKDIVSLDFNVKVHLNKSPNYFVKKYVEQAINQWQQKGEFEKVADYKTRVNEQTRQLKVQQLTEDALKSLKQEYTKGVNWSELTLTPYDSENESYLIKSPKLGQFALKVPIAEAPQLKQNWSSVRFENPDYYIINDSLVLAKVVITNPVNGKKYVYDSKQSTTYMVNSITYNFEPIEVDIPKNDKVLSNTKIESSNINIGKDPVDINIPSTTVVNDKTFALIIGNENYKNEIQVSFAQNDAKVFAEYCKKTLGIPANNVHLLLNGSYGEMLGEIKWIYDIIEVYKGQSRVIFYYAGHGMPDENDKSAYILPVDGNSTMPQTALKIDDIYNKLNSNPSLGVFVFLDACFSGAARDGSLAEGRGVKIKPKQSVLSGNCVVLSATSSDETAFPLNEKGHGLFTYYLLKKIQETKGDVTLCELTNYVVDIVKKQSLVVNGKVQNPKINFSPNIENAWQSMKLK